MASLLDMTDVPMKNILENCGFKSVLTLRKVCHSLRNFIDDSSFKTDLDEIVITIDPNSFSVICRTNPFRDFRGNGTCYAKDWTSNDLKLILKLVQKTNVSNFSVNTNLDSVRGLGELEEILKNLARPLQTENVTMEATGILKVLPYLDSNTLKGIYIRPAKNLAPNQNLDGIEQFLELEQFKNAVRLTIDDCFLVRADLRMFLHFQRVMLKLHETSLEELVALKEAFVASTHMEDFDFHGLKLNKNQLEQVLGSSFHDPLHVLDISQWFFKIQNCKESVLRIYWYSGRLKFRRKLQAKEVPHDAIVLH